MSTVDRELIDRFGSTTETARFVGVTPQYVSKMKREGVPRVVGGLLRLANYVRDRHPETWAAYQDELKKAA